MKICPYCKKMPVIKATCGEAGCQIKHNRRLNKNWFEKWTRRFKEGYRKGFKKRAKFD